MFTYEHVLLWLYQSYLWWFHALTVLLLHPFLLLLLLLLLLYILVSFFFFSLSFFSFHSSFSSNLCHASSLIYDIQNFSSFLVLSNVFPLSISHRFYLSYIFTILLVWINTVYNCPSCFLYTQVMWNSSNYLYVPDVSSVSFLFKLNMSIPPLMVIFSPQLLG